MRGDRPGGGYQHNPTPQATPHARGSTLVFRARDYACGGYPACAGIDLICSYAADLAYGLPRMRGDRPRLQDEAEWDFTATPHARGSTWM